jgi:hypothetical protein
MSPLLPELVTEGDTLDEALANVRLADTPNPVWFETIVGAP